MQHKRKAHFTTKNAKFASKKGSKIVFENNFWRYLYNVTFVDEEVLGISEVKTAPKANVIYDLMGRKVSKANKGLYIVAGIMTTNNHKCLINIYD